MNNVDASWYKKPDKAFPERLAAGGIVVRIEGGTIYIALIIEGRFTDFSLPKGGVKNGEELEEAARREIHEETGISQIELDSYLGKRSRLNITKRRWVTVHYYLFVTEQKNTIPTDKTKKHILKWFPIEKLPNMLWPEQKRLIERNKEKIKSLFEKSTLASS